MTPRFAFVLVASMFAVSCSAGDESTAKPHGAGGSADDSGAGTAGYDSYGGTGGSSSNGGQPGGTGGYNAYGGAPSWEGGVVWKSVTGNLATLDCGGVGFVSIKPGSDVLIAGLGSKQGLWSSADGGATWTHLGATDAGSEVVDSQPTMILYDPTTPTTYWVSGLWGKIYRTTDDGATFKSLGTVSHNDTVSVDFTDPARKTILAGGHEQTQTVQKSTDGGATWTNIGTNLPADSDQSSAVYVVDASTYLVGCSGYAGKAWGVFRTTDGGTTWNRAGTDGATRAPLVASDGSIYFSLQWQKGLTKSTDKGATWAAMVDWGKLETVTPLELPDKRLATVGFDFTAKVSSDAKTWTAVTDKWNQTPNSIAYSAGQKAFYMAHGGCVANKIPPEAIVKMGWDYTAK